MNRLVFSAVFAAGLAVSSAALAQDRVWVSSAGTKLMASGTATAQVVAPLPLGTELSVLATKDTWLQVSTPEGKRGWVYRGKISTAKPAGQGGGLFGAAGKSSISVASADTARSIRGLTPEAEQYAQNVQTPAVYKKAVDDVIALRVTQAEVEQFLKQGKIGEYAE
jgi:hypothetical protein